MTVADTSRRAGPFLGNGVTTAFPFTYKVFSASNVQVVLTDALGVITTLTTGYSISLNADQDNNPGGTVTYPSMGSPLASPATLLLLGDDLPYTQENDITNAGRFLPQAVEDSLDKLTILAQQVKADVDNSIRVPDTDPVRPAVLPVYLTRRDKLLGFNIATGAPELSTFTQTQLATAVAGMSADGAFADTVQFVAFGSGDQAPALATLMNANPYKRVINVLGVSLRFDTSCLITSEGSWLDLNGGSIVAMTNNIDVLTFEPPTAGTTAAFRNGGGLCNGSINMIGVPNSTGWGLKLRQCNLFRLRDVDFYDADMGVYGGQLGKARGCNHFASSGTTKGTGSALIHFQEAPYGAGLYQPCYTFQMTDWTVSAGVLRDACIRIHSGDGITFTGGYAARGQACQVLVQSSRNGSYVGPVRFNGSYLDCVNPSTGTTNSVEVRADGNSSSLVYSLHFNGCTLGNGTGSGVIVRKPETYVVTVNGSYITNFAGFGVDIEAGTTGDILLVGNQFQNNGGATTGQIRLSGTGGKSLNLTANTFTNGENLCVLVGGTWGRGTIVGNANNDAIADISIGSATFTKPLIMSGNSSNYGFPGTEFSWVGEKTILGDYANNAAAVSAGLRTGQLYQTSGAVKVVT